MAQQEYQIATQVSALRSIMSQMKHVYWYSTPNTDVANIGTITMELPVLEDGINFDTGETDVTRIKLISGDTWVSRANAGDADISFQVSSVAGAVNDLLMTKKTNAQVTVTASFNGYTYSGDGYSTAPKKINGALLLAGEPGEPMAYFPNVELFASLVLGDGDSPSYYNVVVTPLSNLSGVTYYVLAGTAASS